MSMSELADLLDRLKSAQRDLIVTAAQAGIMPSEGVVRKIADLENAIAAVDAVIHEEGLDQSKSGG